MEGNNTNKPRALLLFGAPCSGKTTFGEKFADKYKLAYIDLDELVEKHDFSRENIMVVVEQLLKTRQTLVLEGGVRTEKERIELRNLIRNAGYEPALIWIQTDVATIRSRLKNKLRSVKKAKEYYDAEIEKIEAPSDTEHAIILSGKHTFDTQTKHVITGLAGLVEKAKKKKKISL